MPPKPETRKRQSSAIDNPSTAWKKNKQCEPEVKIPSKYLNSFGFINYDKYGNVPWAGEEDAGEILLSDTYKSITKFLGIDCEMVGVGPDKVSALGRVSIINEYGYCVYDTFVNPMVAITDYRTQFSGIRPKDITEAPSVDVVVPKVVKLVQGKTLVGHFIHYDLDVLKLKSHTEIRDTASYFDKLSEDMRTPSLKSLAKIYLSTDIQTGEHSSIQDAQATIKLYLLHRDHWEFSLQDYEFEFDDFF